MKKFLLASTLAAAVMAAAGAASAQDFNGPYVGATIGRASADLENGVVDPLGAFHQFADYGQPMSNLKGSAYGLTVGMNWQNGATVFGVEANYAITKSEGVFDDGVNDVLLLGSVDNLADIRGRVGRASGPTLVYVLAGIATGDAEVIAVDRVASESDLRSNGHTGYVVGIGVEHQLGPRSSIRAEFNRYDLGDESYDYSTTSALFGEEILDLTADVFRVGFNVGF